MQHMTCGICHEPLEAHSYGRGGVDVTLKNGVVRDVLDLKEANASRWRDRDDAYWFARLMQEVGELSSSLVGDHEDPPEHELRQIASIALNWLEKRSAH